MLITMAAAISAGVLLIVIARRLNLPAIVLLLLGGMALGPAVWGDHAIVQPESLGDGLRVIVALAVGLILFEGGLTLDVTGYRSAPTMIKRLLTLGVVLTWLGSATAVMLLFQLPPAQAILAGSLVVVTGPTVIAPLLKRIKINSRLHSILHWEGVLIDPIGVFLAVLCFEWLSERTMQDPLVNFAFRIAAGLGIGVAGGLLISFIVRRRILPEELINIFAFGFAVFIYGVGESIAAEAGLLAVTAAGFVFGFSGTARLKQVRQFKAEITDLLIGTLFILLAARLEFDQFRAFGVEGLIAVAIVMLVIRPLSIFICAYGQDLTLRERTFLSWVAPRGIVAASMASLFAIRMEAVDGIERPKFVETFTYSVIIATIVLQGMTAGRLASLLKVKRPLPTGWLIVGAHAFARRVAGFISRTGGLHVALVDTNTRAIREAHGEGLFAISGDARDAALRDRHDLQGIGNVLALTDNEDLNVRICQIWAEFVARDHVFRCNPTGVHPTDEDIEEGDATGHVVWPRLPKPSLLAAELLRGESAFIEVEAKDHRIGGVTRLGTPLVGLVEGQVTLEPPTQEKMEALPEDSADQWLVLQRHADYLLRSLRPELIGKLAADDLQTLFEKLIDRVTGLYPKLPRDETISELLERESEFPTALGNGVAIPHAFTKSLDTRVCAIAKLKRGLDIGAHDGEPVKLVFLLLSPQGDPEGHLATLADIARLVLDEDVRRRLLKAKSPLEVMSIVRDTGG